MSTIAWQKLGSPTLQSYTTALCTYHGCSTKAKGILLNVLISLAGKIVLIDIEVIDAQLDYNLLLGCSYMYAMRSMASTVFQLLMFSHDGKILTVDQLTYYDPKGPATPKHVIPTIDITIDIISIPSLSAVGPGLFSEVPMKDTFPSLPPSTMLTDTTGLCTISSSTIPTTPQYQLQTQPLSPRNYWGSFPIHTIPFLFPPTDIVSKHVMATLKLPNFMLGIPVWYLEPPTC